MLKKIILGLLALIVITVGGVFVLFQTKGDFLLEKFSAYVQEATGAPLSMAALPSLKVFPQPGLDLGQATWGQGTDLSVSFTSARVRVSAPALLSGKLEISSVELDGLKVDAREGAKKTAPKSGTTPATDTPQAPADLTATLQKVMDRLPGSVSVRNAALTWTPLKGDAQKLEGLNAELEKNGTSLQAKLSGNWNGGPRAAAFTLDSAASLGKALELTLNEATLDAAKGMPWQGKAQVKLKGSLDLAAATANLPSLSISLPGFQMEGAAKADNIWKNPGLTADIKASGAPRPLLEGMGVSLPLKPGALAKLNLNGQVIYSPDKVELKQFKGVIDATTLEGSLAAELKAGNLYGLTVNLSADKIDLDSFLPATTASGAAAPAANPAPAKAPAASAKTAEKAMPLPQQLNADLRIGSFTGMGASAEQVVLKATGKNGVYTLSEASVGKAAYTDIAVENLKAAGSGTPENFTLQPVTCALVKRQNLEVRDINAKITGKNGVYGADPFQAQIFGSPLQAVLSWNSGSGATRLNADAPGLDLNQALIALANKNIVTGKGALKADLTLNSAKPMDTLSGSASFDSTNLTVNLNLIPAEAKLVAGVNQPTFNPATIKVTAQNGLARLTECVFTSTGLGATATGTISLPTQTLDINGKLTVDKIGVLPVRLSGPIASPSYGLDPRGTIQLFDSLLRQGGKGAEDLGKQGLVVPEQIGKEIGKGLNRLFDQLR